MILGLSDKRRLPRDGKVKLGVKEKKEKNGRIIEYPKQTDYFVVPEPIQKVYGEKPKELDIMFLTENMELAFPQFYKCYGSVGLKCMGNGETARIMARGEFVEKACTPNAEECKKACKPVATLKVSLPKVPGFGVWDFNTSSWNSIVNINTCIDMIRALTGGRIAFIPLKLKIEPHTGTIYDPKKDAQFQKEVYVMSITIDGTFADFHSKYKLPEPTETQMRLNEKINNFNQSLHEKRAERNALPPSDTEDFEEFTEGQEESRIFCEDCMHEITDITTTTGSYTADQLAHNSKEKFGKYLCGDCLKEIAREAAEHGH